MSARPLTIASAREGIAERMRVLAERPETLTVRELIERRMETWTGGTAIPYTLRAWQRLIGDYTLDRVDADLMHAARAEIAALPPLAFKGKDHEGAQVFRPKERAAGKSPATINRYMAALSGAFTWAINERITPRGWVNPCRQLRRVPGERERVRYLDDAERVRLLDACRVLEPERGGRNYRGARYPRLYALVLMALCTGARRGELMALRWRDVDLEAGRARLERTKNGDRRVLILLPQVVEALRPFQSSDGARFVFGSPQSAYKVPANVDTAWRRAVKRAELVDFRFHDLRHCCASYLAQNGAPLNVIAEVLGHRKLDMSRRYAHLTVETKAKAMQAALGGIGA